MKGADLSMLGIEPVYDKQQAHYMYGFRARLVLSLSGAERVCC